MILNVNILFMLSGVLINAIGFTVIIVKITSFITNLKDVLDNHEKRISKMEDYFEIKHKRFSDVNI
jgi:uncharacterized protein YoxC